MAWIINNPVNLQGNADANQEDCTYCFWHRWGPSAPSGSTYGENAVTMCS